MVTIEQKLTLFSKLLNQDIKEENEKKMSELEAEYERRMAENKFAVDQEAANIIEQARRRGELKKVELISKGKLCSKKEMLLIKEALVTRFMAALESKVEAFTQTEDYKVYLESIIKGLGSLRGHEDHLEVYLTPADYDRYQGLIKENLAKIGLKVESLTFKVSTQEMLGGLVIKDTILNTRMDESIRELINEKKDEIIEKISIAIRKVGEEAHE